MFKRKINTNNQGEIILSEKKVIEMIQAEPKKKLDFLVKRGYIDKYKPYYGFRNTVFLIDGELLMIEDMRFYILKDFINFNVLIEEDGGDFYDA